MVLCRDLLSLASRPARGNDRALETRLLRGVLVLEVLNKYYILVGRLFLLCL
jgi:hypothetical protein